MTLPGRFPRLERTAQRWRLLLDMIPRQGLAGLFAAVRDADLRRTVALISRPMLVIAGQHDTVTAASHSELITATVPGAKLVVLPAVHLSNVEYHADFMQAVLDFLR